jgi:hypothetical protein
MRRSMASPDWSAEALEAVWETSREYGLRMEVSQQVAVARALARTQHGDATPNDVKDAFTSAGLDRPSNAFAKEVLARVRGVPPKPSLRAVLLDFRGDAIRNLSRQFGGKAKPEGALRNHLLMYLPRRGYAEAQTGRGQTDILLPPPEDALIETKVWTTLQVFEDGMLELGEYIRTEQPKQAFMVVFGDREPLPSIVADHRQDIAEERPLAGLVVPVIVVPFDVVPPSKVGREERKRRKRDGQ